METNQEAPPAQPKKNERKYAAGSIAKNTALAIDGVVPKDWPTYAGPTYIAMSAQKGDRLIYEERDRVVYPVAMASIDASILHYLTQTIPTKKGWFFTTPPTMRTIKDVRDFWAHATQPVPSDTILPVAFATDLTLAHHRLDFDPTPIIKSFDLTMAAPHVAELMSRASNAHALMTWIGSLFDPSAPRQQYIWCHGAGNDGKGTLTRLLQRLLGPSFATEQPPSPNDKFWTSGLVGKRLVVFPDINDRKFVTSGLFKSLSGGDAVRVEFKRGAIVSMDLNAKYIFVSNERPLVTDNRADMRRIIYVHITKPPQYYEGDYEAKMWAEMPVFISYCWHLYREHVKKHGKTPIPTVGDEVMEIARHNTAEWDTILEHHFSEQAKEEQAPVTCSELQNVLKYHYPNQKSERDKLRDYFIKRYKTQLSRPYIKGKQVRAYPGVFLTARPGFPGD